MMTPDGFVRMVQTGRICSECVKRVGFTGLTRFEVEIGEANDKASYLVAVFEPSLSGWKLTEIVPIKPINEWPGFRENQQKAMTTVPTADDNASLDREIEEALRTKGVYVPKR